MSRTAWMRSPAARDGGYDEWMVSATYEQFPSDVPSAVAGYFYTARHGVVDEKTAQATAARSHWAPHVRIWRRHVPEWQEVPVEQPTTAEQS